jgi:hypothetical protein
MLAVSRRLATKMLKFERISFGLTGSAAWQLFAKAPMLHCHARAADA